MHLSNLATRETISVNRFWYQLSVLVFVTQPANIYNNRNENTDFNQK